MKCALLIMLGMALTSGPLRAATSDHPPHGGSLAEALAGHRLDQAMLRPDFAEAAPSAAPAPSSDVYCCDYLTESHDYLGSDDVHDGALVSDVVAPTWTVRTGAVFLERTRPRRRVVLDIMQGQFRGWTDEYNFDVEAGPDVTITRWLTDRAGFELRYFGSMQWEDEQTWQTGQCGL